MKQIIVCFIILFLSINIASASDRAMQVEVKTGAGNKTIPLYTDYYALVVGVGDYQHGWPKLPNPVKDVQEVANTLASLGFRVKLVLDPTAKELREQLDQLVVDGEEKNRAILFYFAGHGHTLEEAGGNPLGYIIPRDTADPLSDKKDFLGKAVSMRDMESYARLIHSRHVLMVFDSCFSGALFTLVRDRPSPYIEEMISQPVRSFITAGDKDEKVPDRSVFKDVFIQGIKDRFADYNKDGYVTGDELGNYLQEKVVNYSNKRQHPQRGKINDPNLDKGDFVFLAGGKIQWEKAAPEVKDGMIHITSVPLSGKLYIDGAYSGETPREISLSPGAHEIVVEKHGYKTQKETVQARAGKDINVKILLEAVGGTIVVKSEPSPAKVYLDGNLIGETPDTITDLKPLRYNIAVKKEGYKDWSKTVELGSGEEVAIVAELVKVQEEAKTVSKSSTGKQIVSEERSEETATSKTSDTWISLPGGAFYIHNVSISPFGSSSLIKGEIMNSSNRSWSLVPFTIEIYNAHDLRLFTQDFSIKDFKRDEIRKFNEVISGYIPIDIARYEITQKHTWGSLIEKPILEEEAALKAGDTWKEPITGMEFIWVPGGSFEMGDLFGDGDGDGKYIRTVRLDGFWLGKYEVTQGEWKKIMWGNPSYFKNGDNYPVEQVSWNDAQEFIKKLNSKHNGRYTFRLPSEAEWEYAARSGGKKEKLPGTNDESLLGEYAWYDKNSKGSTHPVGQKKPNGLGLYDMGGNVWEWCEDVYIGDYSKVGTDNPIYRGSGIYRVIRGGGWVNTAGFLRASDRDISPPAILLRPLGFRLARTP